MTAKKLPKLQPYQQAWLNAHPDRTEEWLRKMLREGFHVHHGDSDHSNNHPDNLFLLERSDHMRLHGIFGLRWRVRYWERKPPEPGPHHDGPDPEPQEGEICAGLSHPQYFPYLNWETKRLQEGQGTEIPYFVQQWEWDEVQARQAGINAKIKATKERNKALKAAAEAGNAAIIHAESAIFPNNPE